MSIRGVDRLLLAAALVSASGTALAQTAAPSPDPLAPVRSMGRPPVWKPFLVGAALRGCHVYVIAPAGANAPSAGFPQLSRTREIFSRFLEIQKILGSEIEARGGRLRAGLYTRQAGVGDVKAKLAEMHQTFERYPFLKEDFPFPEEFYARIGEAERQLAAAGWALTGSTTWLESQEELDRLLPPYKEWQREVSRWIRKVI